MTDPITETVTAVLDRLVAEWLANGRSHCTAPIHINMGPCAEFAEEAEGELDELLAARFGDGAVTCEQKDSIHLEEQGLLPEDWPDYHCFLAVNGRFYDAQATGGVEHPLNLPFFAERRGMIARLRAAAENEEDTPVP